MEGTASTRGQFERAERTEMLTGLQQDEIELLVLRKSLDDIWVVYLDCIDVYQNARAELSKVLSTGFFSLAQANFKSTDRRRYGRDYYDERMKGSRRFDLIDSDDDPGDKFKNHTTSSRPILKSSCVAKSENYDSTAERMADDPTEKVHESEPPVSSADGDKALGQSDEGQDGATEPEKEGPGSESKFQSSDPLTWYGILVPQQLRSAQASFSSAIDSPLLKSANAAAKLRDLEAEIRAKRKWIKKIEKHLGI